MVQLRPKVRANLAQLDTMVNNFFFALTDGRALQIIAGTAKMLERSVV